ncbi:hypothetical protein BESB_025610 [Besnoitia besnoiti]|uniref:Uncharacterized protein n=1 Tax=Besnoitia besnoiti TaxID=94643 RepID=A0A2A9M7G0_BESBE|nr:uncharacterized protein BESB_025610 [Besnoitia besnoiti]PFH31587.1 hypothetical protein BESB_025610 [Besnoitia besnoiti]
MDVHAEKSAVAVLSQTAPTHGVNRPAGTLSDPDPPDLQAGADHVSSAWSQGGEQTPFRDAEFLPHSPKAARMTRELASTQMKLVKLLEEGREGAGNYVRRRIQARMEKAHIYTVPSTWVRDAKRNFRRAAARRHMKMHQLFNKLLVNLHQLNPVPGESNNARHAAGSTVTAHPEGCQLDAADSPEKGSSGGLSSAARNECVSPTSTSSILGCESALHAGAAACTSSASTGTMLERAWSSDRAPKSLASSTNSGSSKVVTCSNAAPADGLSGSQAQESGVTQSGVRSVTGCTSVVGCASASREGFLCSQLRLQLLEHDLRELEREEQRRRESYVRQKFAIAERRGLGFLLSDEPERREFLSAAEAEYEASSPKRVELAYFRQAVAKERQRLASIAPAAILSPQQKSQPSLQQLLTRECVVGADGQSRDEATVATEECKSRAFGPSFFVDLPPGDRLNLGGSPAGESAAVCPDVAASSVKRPVYEAPTGSVRPVVGRSAAAARGDESPGAGSAAVGDTPGPSHFAVFSSDLREHLLTGYRTGPALSFFLKMEIAALRAQIQQVEEDDKEDLDSYVARHIRERMGDVGATTPAARWARDARHNYRRAAIRRNLRLSTSFDLPPPGRPGAFQVLNDGAPSDVTPGTSSGDDSVLLAFYEPSSEGTQAQWGASDDDSIVQMVAAAVDESPWARSVDWATLLGVHAPRDSQLSPVDADSQASAQEDAPQSDSSNISPLP